MVDDSACFYGSACEHVHVPFPISQELGTAESIDLKIEMWLATPQPSLKIEVWLGAHQPWHSRS